MKKYSLYFVLLSGIVSAQTFTKQDTLKGSNTKFRDFWDVKKYELSVEPDFNKRALK